MQVELVRRAQGGDHDAFDRLATDLYDHMVAVASRILRDTDRAEDAVQEALVLAWRDSPAWQTPTGSRPGSTGSSCGLARTPCDGVGAVQ